MYIYIHICIMYVYNRYMSVSPDSDGLWCKHCSTVQTDVHSKGTHLGPSPTLLLRLQHQTLYVG